MHPILAKKKVVFTYACTYTNDFFFVIPYLQRGMGLQNEKLFQMRTNEDFLRRVDDWRRVQVDLPSRAEAIRRLVSIGLEADARLISKPNKP